MIDLQCACKQLKILAVQVSQSALQSWFTEQFFSTSWFMDTKNGRSQCHENKLTLPQNKERRKGKKYCHVQLGVVILISLLLWAAVLFCSNSFSNKYTEWRWEVWGHVTIVAKVLSLNNLSWQRSDSYLHCQMMEERATVFFLSSIMHRKSHTCHFFCFLFFLPYLQDHSFMRSRNFSPLSAWCNNFSFVLIFFFPLTFFFIASKTEGFSWSTRLHWLQVLYEYQGVIILCQMVL